MSVQKQQLINKKQLSLGSKFIFMVVIILLVAMSTAAYVNFTTQKKNFESQLQIRGESLGNFIALTSSDAVLGRDYLLLNQYMEEISHQPDVVYGVILSENGVNLTSYLNRESPYIQFTPESDFMKIIEYIDTFPDIISMRFPINAGDNIGTVVLGISTKKITELSQNVLQQQMLEIILILFFISFSIFLLFKFSVLKPIKELIYSFKCVSGGNLFHTAKIIFNDELGSLARSFNKMTASLKQIHDEKDTIVEQLQISNNNLESATKAKTNFLANMSHEIRTPLTAIIGFGNLLKSNDLSEADKINALNTIVENGIHLQQIINDILDLSKIEANKLDIDCTEESPFKIINDVELLLSLQCSERNLSYSSNLIFPLPKKIKTDPLRFKQILINLCSNAVKFTKQGFIAINMSYDSNKHKLIVNVKDSGIGLSPEQQGKIFEEFTQADSSTTRQFGGTGLGLSLSRQLAKKLGGNISVQSELGKGSCFTLSIDTGQLDNNELVYEAPTINRTSIETESQSNNRRKTLKGNVLLAEDNINNQQLISLYVTRTKANIDIVSDGLQAVESAMNNDYDLILMDMQMPKMDGLEATKILREKGYTKPISALTANTMQHDINLCFDAGCDDFLSKPINVKEFNALLEKYLPADENVNQ